MATCGFGWSVACGLCWVSNREVEISRGRDIERSRYREVDDYTQIYRRSDGFSHRTYFKNQYIFVFIMGANCVSNSLLLSLLMVWSMSAMRVMSRLT